MARDSKVRGFGFPNLGTSIFDGGRICACTWGGEKKNKWHPCFSGKCAKLGVANRVFVTLLIFEKRGIYARPSRRGMEGKMALFFYLSVFPISVWGKPSTFFPISGKG